MRTVLSAAVVLALVGCRPPEAPSLYVPKTHAVELTWQAAQAVAQADLERALALLDEAVTTDPRFALAQVNRATVLGELGRYSEAVEALDKAIALEPERPEAYLARGLFKEKGGLEAEARTDYAKSVALYDAQRFPERDEVRNRLNRARALCLVGDRTGAIRAVSGILIELPGNKDAERLRRHILSGRRELLLGPTADPSNGMDATEAPEAPEPSVQQSGDGSSDI